MNGADGPLCNGGFLTAFQGQNDRDYYWLESGGGRLRVYTRDGGGGCGTTPDPWLTVYSAQGAQLATNDDGGGCGYQSDLSVMIPAGRVYVEVKPFNWTPTRTGNYQLYAEIP